MKCRNWWDLCCSILMNESWLVTGGTWIYFNKNLFCTTCWHIDFQNLSKKILLECFGRWRKNRKGRPLSPPQFVERTFQHQANSTEELLNAGRVHQTPQKAAHCLWEEVGHNIKDKKRDKRGRDGDPSREGSLKKENFLHTRKLSLAGLWRALESQRAK